ncbi:hypothetical protein AQUCO_02000437v1 [Aquilegia coerulea]|uniref:LOB domain-containing protein n=1 Tax=Aquilegia coerulea TaxID=218851 RepID=A0A2G5DHI9_AQUCA|nr:hypothetical protein AQUCO_02000437v1 [Aquilegia coerulea]
MRALSNNPNNKNNHNNHGAQAAACAACKYQRRKCQPDCTLAPYFPPTYQTQFLNVHKLFGVSNILKIIRNLNTQFEKDEAMRTMIQEANNRAADPVGGSHRIVCYWKHQLDLHNAELDLVKNQLAMCRAQLQHAQQMQMNETKLHMMNMNNMVNVPGDDDQEQEQLVLVPYVGHGHGNIDPSIFNVDGASSSMSSSLLIQQNQPFLEMLDESLALESIECGLINVGFFLQFKCLNKCLSILKIHE